MEQSKGERVKGSTRNTRKKKTRAEKEQKWNNADVEMDKEWRSEGNETKET